jgi:hypothetical protein
VATRLTPPEGLPTWGAADPTLPSGPEIPGGLEVEVVEALDTGWTRVRCSNGWEAWVDGRRLVDGGGSHRARFGMPEADIRKVLVALVAVAVVALGVTLLTRRGDDTKTLSAGNAGTSSGKSATSGGSDDPLAVDEAVAMKAIAKANAVPEAELEIAGADEIAAARVSDAMKAAGYDLGPDLIVMSLGAGENLLLLALDDASSLATMEGEKGEAFLKTFVTLPALAEAKVTRIAIDFASKDKKGPFTLSLTARVDDLRKAVEGGEDIGDKAAIQVVRG